MERRLRRSFSSARSTVEDLVEGPGREKWRFLRLGVRVMVFKCFITSNPTFSLQDYLHSEIGAARSTRPVQIWWFLFSTENYYLAPTPGGSRWLPVSPKSYSSEHTYAPRKPLVPVHIHPCSCHKHYTTRRTQCHGRPRKSSFS
jgi:hypothetical protein